jgi:hypothetical protein
MVMKKKTSAAFRILAGLVACLFLWQEVVLAADLIDTTLEHLEADQSQTFAPAYLQSQQALHEDLIARQQAIEDAANYQAAAASQTEPSDANANSETLDLKGPIGGSDLTTSNAILTQVTQSESPETDSSVISVTTSAGDIIYYRDGQIYRIEKKDGIILQGLLINEDNELVAANITFPDGTVEIIVDGKVIMITKPDGSVFNYS